MKDNKKASDSKSRFLRKVDLFSKLKEQTLEEVLSIVTEEKYEKESVVFKEGDKGDSLYIVKSGKINLTKKDGSGKDSTLASLGEGAVIGDMSLVDDQPRSATAVTERDTNCIVITKEDFTALIADNPEIMQAILRMTTERLRTTNSHLKELEASTIQMEKVIGVISNIARRSNILSLNASIEAARAGDSGKGFSVVATEMKKLSELSAKEAGKIQELLGELRSKTKAISLLN